MISDKVIAVSAGWILKALNVSSHLLAATTKDDDYDRCTTLITRKLLRFLQIDQEWSPFLAFFVKRARELAAIRAGSKMDG